PRAPRGAPRRRADRPHGALPARAAAAPRPGRVRAIGPDRKSTRLNSSHQIISYAVFCLKKKKTEKSTQKNPTKQRSQTSATRLPTTTPPNLILLLFAPLTLLPHLLFHCAADPRHLHSFPTRRSSDLLVHREELHAVGPIARTGHYQHARQPRHGLVACGRSA